MLKMNISLCINSLFSPQEAKEKRKILIKSKPTKDLKYKFTHWIQKRDKQVIRRFQRNLELQW